MARVPPYLLDQIERDATSVERVSRGLARQSLGDGPHTPRDFEEYAGLWEEAVTYALGVREDARLAREYGLASLDAALKGAWFDAVEFAYEAVQQEATYVPHARFWLRFLYVLTDFLVASGHGDIHPYLHPRAHPHPPAVPGPRRRSPPRRRDRRRGPRAER